jgi:hypothetical protein
MRRIHSALTYANVVATLALFIALGGASYAAVKLPKNSVGTDQLRKNAVTGTKVADHSLTGHDLDIAKLGTVPAAAHATSADTATRAASAASADTATHATTADSAPIADNSVTSAKITDGTLTGADIADGSLTAADLATGKCPPTTLLYEGACLETEPRAAAAWSDAEAACETLGGHLPSPEQLYGLRTQPGITLNATGEWTGHYWTDSSTVYVELIGQTGLNRKAIIGGQIPYRCSRPPVN